MPVCTFRQGPESEVSEQRLVRASDANLERTLHLQRASHIQIMSLKACSALCHSSDVMMSHARADATDIYLSIWNFICLFILHIKHVFIFDLNGLLEVQRIYVESAII